MCMILIKQSAVHVKRDDGYRVARGIYSHQLYKTRGITDANCMREIRMPTVTEDAETHLLYMQAYCVES
jgi:hypothetical protein